MKTATNTLDIFATAKKVNTGKTTMAKTIADIGPDDIEQVTIDMQDTTNITPTTGTTISADAIEGHAIAKLIGSREAKGIKAFATDTGTNGMDTRLGNLLIKLSAESALPSGRPSRQQLETNGLYKIKGIGNRNLIAIRSSALWFATNRVEAELFNSDTGNTFSNIHSLQQAMAKAEKDAAKEAMEADTDTDDTDTDDTDTDTDDSVIGGVDMNAPKTINEIATETLGILKSNDFQIADLFVEFTKLVAQAETIAVNKLAK